MSASIDISGYYGSREVHGAMNIFQPKLTIKGAKEDPYTYVNPTSHSGYVGQIKLRFLKAHDAMSPVLMMMQKKMTRLKRVYVIIDKPGGAGEYDTENDDRYTLREVIVTSWKQQFGEGLIAEAVEMEAVQWLHAHTRVRDAGIREAADHGWYGGSPPD